MEFIFVRVKVVGATLLELKRIILNHIWVALHLTLNWAWKYLLEKMGSMIKKPKAEVVGVEIKDLSRNGVTYDVKVAVSNPYIIPIPVSDVSYTLKTDDRTIVSGNIGRSQKLPRNKMTVVEVSVRVEHAIFFTLMKDIGRDFDIDYELDLGVIIDLPLFGHFTIPLSWKGEIKLPTLSSIF